MAQMSERASASVLFLVVFASVAMSRVARLQLASARPLDL